MEQMILCQKDVVKSKEYCLPLNIFISQTLRLWMKLKSKIVLSILTTTVRNIKMFTYNIWKEYLNNYFRLHVCLSFRTSHFHFFRFPAVVSKNVTNKSCLACVKNEKYASWVIIRPQWDCRCGGEAEVRIINFKTSWSEFQMPSQTAPTEGKPRCVYSILKPHGQSSITSPDSVLSSCVREHI